MELTMIQPFFRRFLSLQRDLRQTRQGVVTGGLRDYDNTSLNTKTVWTFRCDEHNSIKIRKLCLSAALREFITQPIYFSLKTLVSSRMAYKKIEDI